MSIHDAVTQILVAIGETDREGLKDTPARVEKAWAHWTSGYNQDPKEILKTFIDGGEHYSEMVFQGNIAWFSTCEHHLAPFFGFAHIAYIPNGRIVGLSKLSRLLDVFARRLQCQERITRQVADTLMDVLSPLGCGVVLQARHHCMESRGIQKIGTVTITSEVRGNFKERPEVRSEFMDFVKVAAQGIKTL